MNELTLRFVLTVIALHFFGDFVCQPRWMAENKSSNSVALLLHVVAYTMTALLPLVLVMVWLCTPVAGPALGGGCWPTACFISVQIL